MAMKSALLSKLIKIYVHLTSYHTIYIVNTLINTYTQSHSYTYIYIHPNYFIVALRFLHTINEFVNNQTAN